MKVIVLPDGEKPVHARVLQEQVRTSAKLIQMYQIID